MLPRAVRLANGNDVDLVFFEKPDRPYIVLESKSDCKKEPKERTLHVVFPQHSLPLRVGRGNDCEIKISDISVSRTHAEIFFNEQFFIRDLKSKFGTLVKFKESVEFNSKLQLQYGRACFNFSLHRESKTPREETKEPPLEMTQSKEKIKSESPPREGQNI
jgi:predicted component of type VI protein secretion system